MCKWAAELLYDRCLSILNDFSVPTEDGVEISHVAVLEMVLHQSSLIQLFYHLE